MYAYGNYHPYEIEPGRKISYGRGFRNNYKRIHRPAESVLQNKFAYYIRRDALYKLKNNKRNAAYGAYDKALPKRVFASFVKGALIRRAAGALFFAENGASDRKSVV